MARPLHIRLAAATVTLALGLAAAVAAAAAPPATTAAPRAIPLTVQLRGERVRFDDGEPLGLLGVAVLLEPAAGWWAGPAVVGAADGRRGGLFVLGARVERAWRPTGRWQVRLGLLAGGGGGGGAPVGGGLFLQPSVALLRACGPLRAGVSWSHASFPDGSLDSRQLGLVAQWNGRARGYAATEVGRFSDDPARTGLGLDRLQLHAAALRATARSAATATTPRLVGTRADWRLGRHGWCGLEAAAASHGAADGYMELLGTAGAECTAGALGLGALHLGARGAVGLGGGGAVPTGGGTLAKLAGTLRWELGPRLFVGLEAGTVRSGDGGWRARYAQLAAGATLARPGASGPRRVAAIDWAVCLQDVTAAARKRAAAAALQTVGVKVRRWFGRHGFVTGQAHSAFAGHAGAYAAGLAGAGWASSRGERGLSARAELLGGAAGGGGVDTRGGAVVAGQIGLDCALGRGRHLQLGLGRLRSPGGSLDSTVLELAAGLRFGVAGR